MIEYVTHLFATAEGLAIGAIFLITLPDSLGATESADSYSMAGSASYLCWLWGMLFC